MPEAVRVSPKAVGLVAVRIHRVQVNLGLEGTVTTRIPEGYLTLLILSTLSFLPLRVATAQTALVYSVLWR